jgi:hypothetical protein
VTVVMGLDKILEVNRPWTEQRPTVKQLDWVRQYLGEDELDKIIIQNWNRGQVSDLITAYIRESKRQHRRFCPRPVLRYDGQCNGQSYCGGDNDDWITPYYPSSIDDPWDEPWDEWDEPYYGD